MKLLFMGTPDFAVPSLKALYEDGHEIVGVITQPDRKRNRGKITPCPVKELAITLGLPVYSPEKIKEDGELLAKLKAMSIDAFVVVAYGQILSQEILDIPRLGTINVHGSLLPKYRGASPIQESILKGDSEAGITLMLMSIGMDEGDMLMKKSTPIQNKDANVLSEELANMGALAISQLLENEESFMHAYENRTPQDEEKATYCSKLTKEMGFLDFKDNANVVIRKIQGLYPWPGAYTFTDTGKRLKLHKAKAIDEETASIIEKKAKMPGDIAVYEGHLFIRCIDTAIEILVLQLEGKKALEVKEFLKGVSLDFLGRLGGKK